MRQGGYLKILLVSVLMVSTGAVAAWGKIGNWNYDDEKQTYQFLSRHWDEDEIRTRYESFLNTLSAKKSIDGFIAAGISEQDRKAIEFFFRTFEGKKLTLVYTRLPIMCRVAGVDEFNDMRAVLEFKFQALMDHGRTVEYTVLMNMARLGNAKGMKWMICKLLWKDHGIDVSNVNIFQLEPPRAGEEVCVMTTQAGVIKFRLFPKQAPLAVKNWIGLAKRGFYDNTPFARVIKNFVIQGGALDGSGRESISIYDGFFKNEVTNDLFNFNGALCLGNVGPHTNGNQFYIVQRSDIVAGQQSIISEPANVEAMYRKVGGLPELDGRYTVFGQVYQGMDVVEKIASQATNADDAPLKNPIRILKIEFQKMKSSGGTGSTATPTHR